MAKGILSGKFQYCQDCDDYYLAKSFLSDSETKNARICIYQDPINSGGNDYADGYVDIKYSICSTPTLSIRFVNIIISSTYFEISIKSDSIFSRGFIS